MAEEKVATIQIQFCGGWGYGRFYNMLCVALEDEFEDQVEVTYIRDQGVTGNFEITLLETGEVIHSKKNGGGKCQTEEERNALFEKIREYLGN